MICKFKFKNVWIGDLIYDTYLKVKNKPTIDIKSKDFEDFFLEAIYVFLYCNYKNNVKAVLVSHSTYLYGIVVRTLLYFPQKL